MPLWVRELPSAPNCQQDFATTVLPALQIDKVFLFQEGVILCGVCHSILPGIESVHNHFNTDSHRQFRTPRVRQLRQYACRYVATALPSSPLQRLTPVGARLDAVYPDQWVPGPFFL